MDPRDFESLYRATWQPLLSYALRRTQSPADAADVVGEVYAVAWRRCADVPAGDDARLWLFGVARHVLSNQQRGASRRERLAARLTDAVQPVAPDPAETFEERASAAAVIAALDELSPSDRELLTLSAWDGLAARDVAVVLGVSVALVRVRLHRARARLRRVLDARVQCEATSGHVMASGQLPAPARESS